MFRKMQFIEVHKGEHMAQFNLEKQNTWFKSENSMSTVFIATACEAQSNKEDALLHTRKHMLTNLFSKDHFNHQKLTRW